MSAGSNLLDNTPVTLEALSALGPRTLAELLMPRLGHDPDLRRRVLTVLGRRGADGGAEAAPAGEDGTLVGDSAAMRRVRAAIRKVAGTELPVLLMGESGTGKELAARKVHRLSARREAPFVPINCAALPPGLVAAELFGHEKGAFTGAAQRRTGRIQAARGGTVFLDEIGDLPMEVQGHLLRFLQEGCVDPVGADRPLPVDVRVVAATNVALEEAVAAGRFRQDLYYRLNVFPIRLPPLRERGDDIFVLARHFLDVFAAEEGRLPPVLSDEALAAMREHDWPGNVRELAACMRRALVLADGPAVEAADLGLPDRGGGQGAVSSLEEARRQAEADRIRRALGLAEGNVSRAARELGVSRVTMYRLLQRHGLRRPG